MQRRNFLLGTALTAGAAGYLWHHRFHDVWEAWTPEQGVANKGGGLNYAISDRKLIDYQIYDREGFWLRGPDPGQLSRDDYIAFAGAAQTFGRFTPQPFASLVSHALRAKGLNLGISGAGPGVFLNSPRLLDWINGSRFLVLQVMAGRSAGNSVMQSKGGRAVTYQGQSMAAEAAWELILQDASISASKFWALVEETRADWVRSYTALLRAIDVPVILFFFGKHEPQSNINPTKKPETLADFMGDHPQLVTRGMLDALIPECAEYVEVVSTAGSPQRLAVSVDMLGTGSRKAPPENFSRRNGYYPSPEMHAEAAKALQPVCQRLWEIQA